jgi:hypothetical protein
MALMFLSGDGMAGGSAHYAIEGAPLVGERRTAPIYRGCTQPPTVTASPFWASCTT